MRKTAIILVLFLSFIGCKEPKNKSNLKIIKDYAVPAVLDKITLYKCSDSEIKNNFGKLHVTIEPNLLEIKCVYNKGYGGEIVNIEIDNNLKVITATFDYEDDSVGGNEEEYSITNINITLNKNPFTEGLTDLNGKISMEGTVKLIPKDFFELSKIEKFNYFGYIICD
jgi:hypothetical protein